MVTNKILVSLVFIFLLVGAVSAEVPDGGAVSGSVSGFVSGGIVDISYPAEGGVYNEFVDHIEWNINEGYDVGEDSLCWYDTNEDTGAISSSKVPLGEGTEESPWGDCSQTYVILKNGVTAQKGLNTWSIHVVGLVNDLGGKQGYLIYPVNFYIDLKAPVITLKEDEEITINIGSEYVDAGATASDNYDEELVVEVSGEVDTSVVGVYTITYSVSDTAGNIATATRTVNVVDMSAPKITLLGENPVTIEVGSVYADAGATATLSWYDETDISDSIEIDDSGVDINTIGIYTVYITATNFNINIETGDDLQEIDEIEPKTTTVTRIVNVIAAPSTPVSPVSPSGSSGSSGGSGGCITKWECSEWSECINGQQTRTCSYKENYCAPTLDKPIETMTCSIPSSGNEENSISSENTDLGERAGITGGVIGTTGGKIAIGAFVFTVLIIAGYLFVSAKRK